MSPIPLDEIVPFGTRVKTAESEWGFGDARWQGGMGRVYEVFETQAPFRHGALKMLRPDRAAAAAAFEREIKRIENAVAGKHGPAFYGRGSFEGQPFVIMQFADPVPTGLGIREALPFIDGIAEGLATLQENGYCHGDVKAHNMGLLDGIPGLLDLGSSRPLVPQVESDVLTYTPGLAAPELATNGLAAPWIDVYGLATAHNEILSPKALEVYSPAIRAGMDLRPDKRLPSALAFKERTHACYKTYRRQKLRTRLMRTAEIVLTATLTASTCLYFVSANKHEFRERTCERLQATSVALAYLRTGRFYHDEGDMAKAKEHFKAAADLGSEEAREILRLMEQAEQADANK